MNIVVPLAAGVCKVAKPTRVDTMVQTSNPINRHISIKLQIDYSHCIHYYILINLINLSSLGAGSSPDEGAVILRAVNTGIPEYCCLPACCGTFACLNSYINISP